MLTVTELSERVTQSMRDIGLTQAYISSLARTWTALDEWLNDRGCTYSPEMSRQYLRDVYGIGKISPCRITAINKQRLRAVRVLENCYQHKPYQVFENRRFETYFAPNHEPTLTPFLQSLDGCMSESTIASYVAAMNKLSSYMVAHGIARVEDLATKDIVLFMEHVASGWAGQQTVYSTASKLRGLFRWLAAEGVVEPALVDAVPKVKPPQKRLPDVYTDEEVEEMLRSVDTASPKGKRDYVICLLAARLGMRASDIVNLKLENLHWKRNVIEFTTVKTGQLTTLPLTNEIGEAIIDYLKNGRPECDTKHVFVSLSKPLGPLKAASAHTLVRSALTTAGVACNGRRRGPHALRSSMATKMMMADVPLPVISATLSHAESDTTRIYLKVDTGKLRTCALEVKPLVNLWWKER